MDKFIKESLENKYALIKKDIGEYSKIDKSPMHFITEAYEIKGIGSLSIINMKAMLGLMKMITVVITPLDKEMPLFSCDIIKALGNNTTILELYNTKNELDDLPELMEIKNKYKDIPDYQVEPHWYDSIRLKETIQKKAKKMDKILNEMAKEYVSKYLEILEKRNAPDSKENKYKLTEEYVMNLYSKGGPAVNQFKKIIGDEKTKVFLRKVMFGIDE